MTDPADHARAMRESLAAKGAQLSDVMSRTNHNGQVAPPPAPPLAAVPDLPPSQAGWGSADTGPMGSPPEPAPTRAPSMHEKLFAVLHADQTGRDYNAVLAETIKANPWGGDAA